MSHPRSSPRSGQEGAVAMSIGVVFLLLVAAGLLALLLTADPKATPQTRIDRTDYPDTGEVQMPADGYRLVWRAREDGTGAPTLALFLRPNDAIEVSSSRSGLKIVTGSETLQRVVAPGIDSLRADPASGPAPCSESPEPFAGRASTGVASMTLKRGDSTTELYAALEELRLPRVDPDPRMRPKEAPQQDLRIFRTEADPKTKRIAIHSWSCLQGTGQRLVPAPGPDCVPPAQAGAGRSAVLFECGGGFCRAHFLFQQRLADLLFEFVPSTAAPEMRMRLFLTAWEMLNRQQVDASGPLDVEFDRADTLVQLEACRNIAREASRGIDRGQFRASNGFDLWHNRVARSCQRVEKTALRFAKSDPDWASGVLGKLLDIYHQAGLRINKELHEARFAMLEQRGAGETQEMFDAMVNYLRHDGFAGLDGKDPMVPRALELAGKLKLPASDPRVRLVRERMDSGRRFQEQVADGQRQRQRTP